MSHHKRLELRLLSRNSQLQFGQTFSFFRLAPLSSDRAETASAVSNGNGCPASPNGASALADEFVAPVERRSAGAQERGQRARIDALAGDASAKQRVDRFPEVSHQRRDRFGISDGQQPAYLLPAEDRGCRSKAPDLGRIVEAIEPP